jgi:hypothetical protein
MIMVIVTPRHRRRRCRRCHCGRAVAVTSLLSPCCCRLVMVAVIVALSWSQSWSQSPLLSPHVIAVVVVAVVTLR